MTDDKSAGKIVLGGLFGAAAAAFITGILNFQLEQKKFEFSSRIERQKYDNSLIAQALDSDDENVRASRLKFLLSLGMIHDEVLSKKLAEKAKDPETLPQIPQTGSPAIITPADSTEWQVIIGDYSSEQEQQRKQADATKAGYSNGEPFGDPPYRHLRFRFNSREAAKNAADTFKSAKISHEPDVLRYQPKH